MRAERFFSRSREAVWTGAGLLARGRLAPDLGRPGGDRLGLARDAAIAGLVAFALAQALAPLLSFLLKVLIDRPWPPGGLVHPVGSSHPSGHATDFGATAVALVLLFTAARPGRRPWWIASGLGIAIMVFGAAQRWRPA